jgi:hypothetical protein
MDILPSAQMGKRLLLMGICQHPQFRDKHEQPTGRTNHFPGDIRACMEVESPDEAKSP